MEVREQGAAAADLIRSIVGEERGQEKIFTYVFSFFSGHLLPAQYKSISNGARKSRRNRTFPTDLGVRAAQIRTRKYGRSVLEVQGPRNSPHDPY
jgi:hypothetical protein